MAPRPLMVLRRPRLLLCRRMPQLKPLGEVPPQEPVADAVALATVETQPEAPAALVTVKLKKDDSIVAEGLSQADAEELVAKAKAAKKAALYIA